MTEAVLRAQGVSEDEIPDKARRVAGRLLTEGDLETGANISAAFTEDED